MNRSAPVTALHCMRRQKIHRCRGTQSSCLLARPDPLFKPISARFIPSPDTPPWIFASETASASKTQLVASPPDIALAASACLLFP